MCVCVRVYLACGRARFHCTHLVTLIEFCGFARLIDVVEPT